jgi:serine/threonine-protein kinase RsbW
VDDPPGRTQRALRLRCRAEAGELRGIRHSVERWAAGLGLPADVLIDLQLAVEEAAANGVEHAYATGPPGAVEVHLELRSSGPRAVAVRVADEGCWQPPSRAGSHRGRGLALIDGVADRLEVQSTRFGTQVCFEIPVPA